MQVFEITFDKQIIFENLKKILVALRNCFLEKKQKIEYLSSFSSMPERAGFHSMFQQRKKKKAGTVNLLKQFCTVFVKC